MTTHYQRSIPTPTSWLQATEYDLPPDMSDIDSEFPDLSHIDPSVWEMATPAGRIRIIRSCS